MHVWLWFSERFFARRIPCMYFGGTPRALVYRPCAQTTSVSVRAELASRSDRNMERNGHNVYHPLIVVGRARRAVEVKTCLLSARQPLRFPMFLLSVAERSSNLAARTR